MAAEIELPVYVRVGDGAEVEIGTITFDGSEEPGVEMGAFLRAAAAAYEAAPTQDAADADQAHRDDG